MPIKLSHNNHPRNFKDFKYVYPVLSRRSGGLSLGININTNNTCNYRCIYCQVEGLNRGTPEVIDIATLEYELDYMLNWILYGDFWESVQTRQPNRFNDIAISGNGEPTLSKQFLEVVQTISKVRSKYNLQDSVKTILITNGSRVAHVIDALVLLNNNNGEIWFKVDSVTDNGIKYINQVNLSIDHIRSNFLMASKICKTYIQTCIFDDNKSSNWGSFEYIAFVASIKQHIAGVLLYTVARDRALPEGKDIMPVDSTYMADIADQLKSMGIAVTYYT